jgi:hypothetical protein
MMRMKRPAAIPASIPKLWGREKVSQSPALDSGSNDKRNLHGEGTDLLRIGNLVVGYSKPSHRPTAEQEKGQPCFSAISSLRVVERLTQS